MNYHQPYQHQSEINAKKERESRLEMGSTINDPFVDPIYENSFKKEVRELFGQRFIDVKPLDMDWREYYNDLYNTYIERKRYLKLDMIENIEKFQLVNLYLDNKYYKLLSDKYNLLNDKDLFKFAVENENMEIIDHISRKNSYESLGREEDEVVEIKYDKSWIDHQYIKELVENGNSWIFKFILKYDINNLITYSYMAIKSRHYNFLNYLSTYQIKKIIIISTLDIYIIYKNLANKLSKMGVDIQLNDNIISTLQRVKIENNGDEIIDDINYFYSKINDLELLYSPRVLDKIGINTPADLAIHKAIDMIIDEIIHKKIQYSSYGNQILDTIGSLMILSNVRYLPDSYGMDLINQELYNNNNDNDNYMRELRTLFNSYLKK
jgi:hypothetical protein